MRAGRGIVPSKPSPLFAESLMIMAAVRYCLGRQSYIVGACITWLDSNWHLLDNSTRKVIFNDIIEALHLNEAGSKYDTDDWKRFAQRVFLTFAPADQNFLKMSAARWPLDDDPLAELVIKRKNAKKK